MADEYTKLELDIEWGETEATAQKRTIPVVLQGKHQDVFEPKYVKTVGINYAFLIGIKQPVTYFICQNIDDTNEFEIRADSGETFVMLLAGEFAVIPGLSKEGTIGGAGDYIRLYKTTGSPVGRVVLIGEPTDG